MLVEPPLPAAVPGAPPELEPPARPPRATVALEPAVAPLPPEPLAPPEREFEVMEPEQAGTPNAAASTVALATAARRAPNMEVDEECVIEPFMRD